MKKDMLHGAEKLLNTCLRLKAKEDLLIIADMPNQAVAEVIAQVGKKIGAEVSMVLIEQRKNHADNPPKPIISAMKDADAIVITTVLSMSNSQARRDACDHGARVISIPGCSERTLIEGAIEEDFLAVEPILRKVGKVLTNGKEISIKNKSGSDFTVTLDGKNSVDQTCMAFTPGSWSPFPLLETAVGPASVNGKIVVDGSIIPGGPPDSPVEITLKNSVITRIEGTKSAKQLDDYLKAFNDSTVYKVVELGIGMNSKAVIGSGSMAEDESQFGTLHLGVGEGRNFGIPNIAPTHIDLVIRMPEVIVDGKVLLKEEKLSI